MVGPGTGIAPFRGFLHERAQQPDAGRAWLFFGERQQAHDFLYGTELEKFKADGTLSLLDLAFSRDEGPKTYVQDKMRDNGATLWEWIDAGGIFYICGDGKAMAPDVEAVLLDIIKEHGHQSDPQSYLDEMRREKRYLLDVY
jgi:sulfite reductase (NADPH) flavoprotein alpha-component